MYAVNYSSAPLVLSTSMVGPATVINPGARTLNVPQGVLKTQHGDVACVAWSLLPKYRNTNTKAFSFKTTNTHIEVFDRVAEPAKCLKANDKTHRRPHPTALIRVVNLTTHIIAICDLLIPPLCQRRVKSCTKWIKIPHKFKPMVDNVEWCSLDGLVLQIEPAC